MRGLSDRLLGSPQLVFDSPIFPVIASRCLTAIHGGYADSRLWEGTLLIMTAAALADFKLATQLVKARPSGLAPWQLRRVTEFLQENMAREVQLIELASLISMSPTHFCRAFKAAAGVPPHEWQICRRLEQAQRLLIATDLSVATIAEDVGYRKPNQLSRLFRARLGLTPREYRKLRT